jgi:CHAD domain-containing protein
MEIEAKFIVPDENTFQRLQAAGDLAGYELTASRVKTVHDTYLDAAGRPVLAAGYACRQREQDEGALVTLKGLGAAEDAIHRREELEVLLAASTPPAEWPASPVRDRVQQLIGDASLMPLFELRQVRDVRSLSTGQRDGLEGRVVAEWSLDQVSVVAGGQEQAYFELEVELTGQGTEDDLATIVACLQDEWGLKPEPRSKFERGLTLLDEMASDSRLLEPRERAVCQRIAERDDLYGRRARALLALDEGATQAEAGQRAGMSDRRVRHWLAAFRQRRLDVFPVHVLGWAAEQTRIGDEIERAPVPAPDLEHRPEVIEAVKVSAPEPSQPGLEPDDSMIEAARKTFYFHFRRMLKHEPGTRLGEDIEELHDMRVATRRMRAAVRVFGNYLDMGRIKPFIKGMRRTGRALGRVRDLDVFWEKTQRYLDGLPADRQDELEPLRVVWEAERARARERMLAYLDSDAYRRFAERFNESLQRPDRWAFSGLSDDGEPLPHRLRHVVPVVVYQRLATVRAYDEWVTGPNVPMERLHQLRIAAKGLRYAVEYFQEVLSPDAKDLINEIKRLQDHLGDFQDAVVACNLLRDFLTWGTWGHAQQEGAAVSIPEEPIVAPGVVTYLAARQIELQNLLNTFPKAWARIQNPGFSQLVARVLATL